MTSMKLNDQAFTGLEAAIVLIAFVVVAAVFSYVVLGAGFFTTQKAQETVYAGSQQASSSFETVGQVYGLAKTTDAYLDYVRFTVGNTAGGSSMDITQMAVTYVDDKNRQNMHYSPLTGSNLVDAIIANEDGRSLWGIEKRVGGNDNDLLEKGEQFTLLTGVQSTAKTNSRFTINLLPSKAAPNALHRNVPAGLSSVNILF